MNRIARVLSNTYTQIMSIFNKLFFRSGSGNNLHSDDASDKGTDRLYPFYIKTPLILVGLYVFFYMLFLLRGILVPICFSVLIGILLNPVVNRLMKWKVPKVIAILLALLLAVILLLGIITFISAQVAHFSELAPQFKTKGLELLHTLQQWVQQTFNVPLAKQNAAIKDAMNNSQAFVGQTLGTMFGVIGVVVLLPIYIFLILYYKPLFINFFYDVFDDIHEKKVAEILNQSKSAVQSYIVGLLIEMVIVAALNSTALLILGVKYAILLGVIGAILNIIPYVGGLIAIAMPVVMALVLGDDGYTTPLLVIGSYAVIQFIDNNVIVPRIVSSKVEVNAFVTILIVLMGGSIWGLAGMFLAVPFIATCKIIFDRIDNMKPWGRLLGVKLDNLPPGNVVKPIDVKAMKEEEG